MKFEVIARGTYYLLVTILIQVLVPDISFATSIRKNFTAIDSPIRVTCGPYEGNDYDLGVTVETEQGRVTYGTVFFTEDQATVEREFKKGILVIGPYVFLPYTCMCNNSGGTGYVTFKAGAKIKYLGYIASGEEGLPYSDGLFFGQYCQLERNDLTSHANGPRIATVMREIEGKFIVDKRLTWAKNKESFEKAMKLRPVQVTQEQQCEDIDVYIKREGDLDGPAGLLLTSAVLCAYLKEPDKLSQTLEVAKKVLPDGHYKTLLRELGQVRPFDPEIDLDGLQILSKP